MPAETLKEYLVALGWKVDKTGFNESMKMFSLFESNAKGKLRNILSTVNKASGTFFSALLTGTKAVGNLISGVASSDQSVERFARKMWTSENAARSLTTALNAVGASYEEIFYMTPEEYRNLIELKNFGNSIQAPKELQNDLRLIRDVIQEFNKLKVIFNYGTQWVVYYFMRYMGSEATSLRDAMKNLNNWLVEHLPSITQKIAKFMYYIYRMAKTVYEVITTVIDLIKKFWNSISYESKAGIGVIGGLFAMLKMGPIGRFIALLTTLILLVDDFMTWKRGGKSALPGIWEQLDKFTSKLDFSRLQKGSEVFLSSIWNIFDALGNLITRFDETGDSALIFNEFFDALGRTIEVIGDGLNWIADLLYVITGQFDELSENSWFRKITKFNPDGSVNWWGTNSNASVGIISGIQDAWNKLFNDKDKNGPLYWTPVDEALGYNYDTSTAIKSTIGTTQKIQAGDTKTVTQNNNITINGGSDSAQTIADEISNTLYKQRANLDMIK